MKKIYAQAGQTIKKEVAQSLRKRHSIPRWALLLLALIAVPFFNAAFPDRTTGSPQVANAITTGTESEQLSSDCTLSMGLPQSVRQWQEQICLAAHEFSLDPNLIGALIWWESNGDLWAVSHADARGLMQVMPFHFGVKADGDYTQKEVEKMHAPLSNIRHGVSYLRKCVDASQAAGLARWSALAAYNGGISGVIGQRVYWNESIRLANGVEELYQQVRR